MRPLLAALLLAALLLPAPGAGALPAADLPRASDVVPRIATPAATEPGADGPLLADVVPGPRQPGAERPAADQGAPGKGVGLPASDPYARLLSDLAHRDGLAGAVDAYRAFAAGMGWAAPPSEPREFEENSTVAYTHDIGDVDRDGVPDLAVDLYCVPTQGCPDFANRYSVAGQGVLTSGTLCSEPHILLAVSGRDGHEIRNISLDAPHSVPVVVVGGCALSFVAGTVPLADGTRGVLVYDIGMVEALYPRLELRHVLRLLDMKTGEALWRHETTGHYLANIQLGCYIATADSLVINPILQQPAARGVSPTSRSLVDTLDVQDVGFNMTSCNTITSDGYVLRAPLWPVNDYAPDEWLTRLDPRTGEVLWRVKSFAPDEAAHSVLPRFVFRTPLGGSYPPADLSWDIVQVVRLHDRYWNERGCCSDLTGDGVNDLAATTLEWSDNPDANTDGIEGFRLRLVVFDGATGGRHSDTVLVDDTDALVVNARLEPFGDADGDGDADLLVHVVSAFPYYRHVLSVRGGDGAEAWRIDNPRDLDVLVVGDADRDGGNDLLLAEWHACEGSFLGCVPITTPFTNVTHLPLKVFRGADGSLLWRKDSFGAAIDTVLLFANLRANGVPDLDGNGVAEAIVDDPTLLPDRTWIHRLAFIDPRDGKASARIVSVGAFALPALAGDSDGDGRDDLALLNGDINDLWLTMHDPDGSPQWSRRLSTPRLSGYATAIPLLRTHALDAIGRPGQDLLVNFQLAYVTVGGLIQSSSLAQQLTGVRGNGTLVWATPGLYDENATEATDGASPASALFAKALARDARPLSAEAARVGGLAAPGALVFAAAAVAAFLVIRRLRL